MIYRNFEDEMEEFSESFFTLSCDDFDGPLSRRWNVRLLLDYSKQVFKNESVSKIFSDILLYRWQEYILHNEETGEYPYDDDED